MRNKSFWIALLALIATFLAVSLIIVIFFLPISNKGTIFASHDLNSPGEDWTLIQHELNRDYLIFDKGEAYSSWYYKNENFFIEEENKENVINSFEKIVESVSGKTLEEIKKNPNASKYICMLDQREEYCYIEYFIPKYESTNKQAYTISISLDKITQEEKGPYWEVVVTSKPYPNSSTDVVYNSVV